MPKLFVSRWSVGVCVPVSKTSKNEKRKKKNYAGVSIKELFEILRKKKNIYFQCLCAFMRP